MKGKKAKAMETVQFRFCTSFASKVVGLLKARSHDDTAALLIPCKSIHTFGMKAHIDVAFIDKHGKIVLAARNVSPGSKISCKKAFCVFERVAHAQDAWFCEGQNVAELLLNVVRNHQPGAQATLPRIDTFDKDDQEHTYIAIPALTHVCPQDKEIC